MTIDIHDIEDIIRQQENWRQTQTINLIASENMPSDAVRRVQNSDFMGRYAEGHPNEGEHVNRYYQGTQYIDQIERMAEHELLNLFAAQQADVRPGRLRRHGRVPVAGSMGGSLAGGTVIGRRRRGIGQPRSGISVAARTIER